jgi:hypothetical protein
MRLSAVCIVLILLMGLSVGCDEPVDGCLDIEAVNLNVEADRPCDDCCQYPRWQLSVLQEYGGSIFRENQPVLNLADQWFRIKQISFYLSDFQADRVGEAFSVEDTLTMRAFGASPADTTSALLKNDMQLVRRLTVLYPVGRFRTSGSFDALSCQLGLLPDANRVIPRYAPAAHPLAKQPDSLWLNANDGYVWMQVVLTRDTLAATVPDTLRFTAADLTGVPRIATSGSYSHERGFDFKVNLKADFGILLGDLDLQNGTPAQWKSQIATKVKDAFWFTQ